MLGEKDLIYFGSILLLSGKDRDRDITDSQVDKAIDVASIVFNKIFDNEN